MASWKRARSPYASYDEAARAIAEKFIFENGSPQQEFCEELVDLILPALVKDGCLPNRYEVAALIGAVPIDGREYDPESYEWPDDVIEFGCPEEVTRKFPNVNKIIEDQF